MPRIPIDGRELRSVSTDIFGERTPEGTEVTLVITRQGNVQMAEHDLMVQYARECLADSSMQLQDYADQVLAPHPMYEDGLYVPVEWAFDHNGTHSTLVLFHKYQVGFASEPGSGSGTPGGRLYEWPI